MDIRLSVTDQEHAALAMIAGKNNVTIGELLRTKLQSQLAAYVQAYQEECRQERSDNVAPAPTAEPEQTTDAIAGQSDR
jgi:hypothetical protein